jgi:AbiU2
MGDELGKVYSALWQEVAWVHAKWSDFVTLFGTKASRVDLLNAAAPAFCRLAQDSIWENVLLHIARLTDPPATAKKQNLTIQRLPPLIDRTNSRSLVDSKVRDALTTCSFARDWRNRHIAHSDLDLKVSATARPLEFASRQSVKLALTTLSDVLNCVATEYQDSTSRFEALDGDALTLLYVIDDGLRAHEQRRQRLKDGIHDPDAFKPREL